MRELSLEELHTELLHIGATSTPSSPDLAAVLNAVRNELNKQDADPKDKKPLSDWCEVFPMLSTILAE